MITLVSSQWGLGPTLMHRTVCSTKIQRSTKGWRNLLKTEAIDQRWKQLAIYLVLQMSLKIFFLLVEKDTNNFWYFDLMSYFIAFLIAKLPAPWKLTFLQIWWIYNYCSTSTDCEKCSFGHFMQKFSFKFVGIKRGRLFQNPEPIKIDKKIIPKIALG